MTRQSVGWDYPKGGRVLALSMICYHMPSQIYHTYLWIYIYIYIYIWYIIYIYLPCRCANLTWFGHQSLCAGTAEGDGTLRRLSSCGDVFLKRSCDGLASDCVLPCDCLTWHTVHNIEMRMSYVTDDEPSAKTRVHQFNSSGFAMDCWCLPKLFPKICLVIAVYWVLHGSD